MVALESLKISDGDTGELGNNHDMYPPNRQRRTVPLLVIDMNFNKNRVALKPVAELPH